MPGIETAMSGTSSPTSPTCGWVLLPEFHSPSTPPPRQRSKARNKPCLRRQCLSQNWEWKQYVEGEKLGDTAEEEGWTRTKVPTEIVSDLLDAGRIKDPFIDRNEEGVQWVGEKDWIYRTTFNVDKELAEGEKVDLVFEGLDTFADIYLNDKLILQSELPGFTSKLGMLTVEHVP